MKIHLLIVGLLVLASTPTTAQRTDGGNVDRNDCRLAAQIVRTGHPAPHRAWAYEIISECAETGQAALAAAWETSPTEQATLQLLVRASSKLRTRTVFAGVLNAARDGQNSVLIRTYAIGLLYSYAHPGSSLNIQDLLRPRGERPPRVYRVSGDGNRTNGDLGDVRGEIRSALLEIIGSEQDPSLQRSAQAVLRWVLKDT